MKTLYLECNMGAAGDMLTAALLELAEDKQAFLDRMNSLGLPGVQVEAEPAVKCGTGKRKSPARTGMSILTTMTMSMSMNTNIITTTTTMITTTIMSIIITMLPPGILKP